MDWDFSPLTKRLNEAVEQSGLTLEELSKQTEIPIRSLKEFLSGKRYPKIKLLLKIRSVLGVSLDSLLFPEGRK